MERSQLYKALAIVVIITLVAAGILIYVYSSNKRDDFKGIPTIEPYINDDVGILIESDFNYLQEYCTYLEMNNSCEVVLLIVNDTGNYDLNTFAIKIFEKNGIGQKDKDNGVLVVFLVPDAGDIRWRTVTGDGVSGILSGFVLKGFENNYLIPEMGTDLSLAIAMYVDAIAYELEVKYISEGNDPWSDYPIFFIPLKGWQLVAAIIILIFLTIITRGRILFFLPYLFSRGGRGGFGGGGTGGGGSRGRF